MKKYSISMGFLAGAAMVLAAAAPLAPQLTLEPSSRIWVSGTSSVKSFKCETRSISASIQSPAASATSPLALSKLVSGADVGLDVSKLECGNGTMNEHMRKALKMTEFPKISFKLDSYTLGADNTVTLKGVLTMAGQDRPVSLTGTITEEAGLVHTSASVQVNMKDWGVKPPSLMMGTMKVKELATIGFDVTVKR